MNISTTGRNATAMPRPVLLRTASHSGVPVRPPHPQPLGPTKSPKTPTIWTPRNCPVGQAYGLSHAAKRAYFAAMRMKHPVLNAALEQLVLAAQPESGFDIILLIGPTGVGKSTIGEIFVQQLLEEFRAEMLANPTLIPVISFDGPASGEVKFAWRMFWSTGLEQLEDPSLCRKYEDIAIVGGAVTKSTPRGDTVAGLKGSFQKQLVARETKIIVIDEAAMILTQAKEAALIATMNALRSLTNINGRKLVMIGSYDLYKLLMLNGQLARRTAVVHVPRYTGNEFLKSDAETKTSSSDLPANEGRTISQFEAVINFFQTWLPLQDVPDLRSYTSQLLSGTNGCAGTLKQTLQRALAYALAKGSWDEECLEKALLPKLQLKRILEEIQEGEKLIDGAILGSGQFSEQTSGPLKGSR